MMIEDVEPGPKDIFLESLKRCDGAPMFLETFYERFLASSASVREKFAFTDFHRQRRMLRRSLELIAKATAGDPDGLRELNDRAESHGHARLNIEPELYDLWTETLISAARDADPVSSAGVERAWRTILGIAIRHMLARQAAHR